MKTPRLAVLCGALIALTSLAVVPSAQAASPVWRVHSMANTTVQPGGTLEYRFEATNVGDAATDGQIDFRAELPPGMTAESASLIQMSTHLADPCFDAADGTSPVAGASGVTCSTKNVVPAIKQGPSSIEKLSLTVKAPSFAAEALTATFSLSGGGAAPAATVDPTRVSPSPLGFGIDAFDSLYGSEAGEPLPQAGGHPEVSQVSIDFNTLTDPAPLRGSLWPAEPIKDVLTDLPAGFAGNPTPLDRCTLTQLLNNNGTIDPRPLCPATSQVGTTTVFLRRVPPGDSSSPDPYSRLPVFNLVPPPGVPAAFAFNFAGSIVVLEARLRSADGYAISVDAQNIPEILPIAGTDVAFWGDPASPGHDAERSCPGQQPPGNNGPSAPADCPGDYTRPEHQAFLRNPTACTVPGHGLTTTIHADSWFHPGAYVEKSVTSHAAPGYPFPDEPSLFPAAYAGPTERGPVVGIEGCQAVPFAPTFSALPSTDQADSPTGLDVSISMPQNGLDETAAIAESDLKKAVVTLPEGISVNPAAANGQGACSAAQIGFKPGTSHPYEFTEAPQQCPDASKIGTVELESPLLGQYDSDGNPVKDPEGHVVPEILKGAVYLAQQQDNPFGSLLAMYLVVEDEASGTTLKLPGEISADPNTGRLTTTFDENPQLPFEHLRLHLFGGARAALKTPPACGTYSTQATLSGWSGKTVEEASAFTIDKGPNGGSCPAGSFAPKLSAGTQNPLAATTSPFNLRLSREDGEQQLSGLTATLAPGLSGYLKGIPYCPDSVLNAISAAPGTGAAQIANPSCPAASQVGTVTVGAGAGANPFYTSSGRAYLAGPYKSAPLSLAVVTPAVAGPFDLGSVLVRNALRIDPETAQITAVSDPFPTILYGIPLDLRDVRVDLNRDHFTLNPTSCEPMQIASTITSTQGATASPSQRFQVSGCDALGLKPKLSLKLRGSTRRAGNPALTATLAMPAGGANIAAASVALPRSEFLDQAHIKTICTRVQFAADQCPAGSIYGKATATTPILDQPLSGNVYLRSSNHNLPDLVMKLRGPASQPIEIDAVGRIDTFHRGIRTTFETVPDAPLAKLVLAMPGGKKSLLENSTDICRSTNRATARFTGHNGKLADFRPVLKAKCPKRKSHRHHRHKR